MAPGNFVGFGKQAPGNAFATRRLRDGQLADVDAVVPHRREGTPDERLIFVRDDERLLGSFGLELFNTHLGERRRRIDPAIHEGESLANEIHEVGPSAETFGRSADSHTRRRALPSTPADGTPLQCCCLRDR